MFNSVLFDFYENGVLVDLSEYPEINPYRGGCDVSAIKAILNNMRNLWIQSCACFQRFKWGFSNRDVGDIDSWFVKTMSLILKKYRATHWGVPIEYKDNPDEWDERIDEMITCLGLMSEESALDFYGEENYERSNNPTDEVLTIMDTNKKIFFELFEKHFYNLWD